MGSRSLAYWGQLWDNNCPGSHEYLYLSYTDIQPHNPQIKSAGYGQSVGVNWQTQTFSVYSKITADVCDNNLGGWHCGTPQPKPPFS